MCDDSMKLPAGKSCNDCAHLERCAALFGVNAQNVTCDFAPSRYAENWKRRAELAEGRLDALRRLPAGWRMNAEHLSVRILADSLEGWFKDGCPTK